MIEALDELHVALKELVSAASGVPLSQVILADQGRPSPEGLYATYNPIPVRAYGQPRKDRELTPAEETGPTQDWEDLAETTVTQLELMLSVNFIGGSAVESAARTAAMKMQNANFRVPVHSILWDNGIGWRNASEVRRLTELTQGGLQPRYQTDVDLFIEMSITDTVLAAAGFGFEVEDEFGNVLAREGGDIFVYTGDGSDAVRKFDTSGNEITTDNWPFTGHSSDITDLAVYYNQYVYTASEDGTVRKLDAVTGSEITTGGWPFTAHTDGVRAVDVDTAGNVYTGSRDGTVRKADSNGNEITSGGWPFTGHTGSVNAVAVHAGGNVYTGGADRVVRKLDSDGNEVTAGNWPFTGHSDPVLGLAVDLSENVYTASGDYTARGLDSDGKQLWLLDVFNFSDVTSVSVDSSQNAYISSDDETIRKANGGTVLWTFTGHTDDTLDTAVSVPGKVYTVGSGGDSSVRQLDSEGNQEWINTNSAPFGVTCVAVTPGAYGAGFWE